MELPPINQRFKELIEWYAKGNVAEFSRLIGQDSQKINRLFKLDSRNKTKETFPKPTTEIILAVTNMFPEVSHTWIMTGTLPMIISKINESHVAYGKCKKCEEIKDKLEMIKNRNIELLEENSKLHNELKKIYEDHPNIPRPRPLAYGKVTDG